MKRPPGKHMRERARQLRRERTPAEDLLWRHLRDRRLEGFKFRNQMGLCGFIADFACVEAKLVVEADGSQHRFATDYDARRSTAFAAQGYRTLRFTNDEILGALDCVLANIRDALALTLPPGCAGRAPPSPRTGEGKSDAPR
jgi:very-short-patch-repair endonuclease